jgi:hypothetical protein
MKSVVVDMRTFDWEGDRPLRRAFRGTVIYEMHVAGFTCHPNSGVAAEKRGTYLGVLEKIPYLQALGITAVELLPVYQFDPQDAAPGLENYWGYGPVSFFAPHLGYSTSNDPLVCLDEFRTTVKELHRAGIEVILDVVYNHTAEGGEVVMFLRGEANGCAVSIRTDLAPELPKVTADRVQLQQVLMNLMLNSIEAMKDTGGVLTMSSQLREDGQIQISIHDTGPGLSLGNADQIFDAFFTTKPQGSGMGLAISKSIVESHGGRIWANGNGGRGATFHFALPVAPEETNPPVDAA